MTTIAAFYRKLQTALATVLPAPEAKAAAAIIMEDVAGYSRTKIFTDGDRGLSEFMEEKLLAVLARVKTGEPVQYAVGRARFMGNDFAVGPGVLIPRPETAQLVDMIVDRYSHRSDLAVLDIGTGSGCIAISLARALPFARVTATDISDAALAVAAANSAALHTDVLFEKEDIFSAPLPAAPLYNIVVSNPPYIAESERADMDARVVDYEPETALFVPDSDPLQFYRAIGRYALEALVPGGGLFFEINRRFGTETCRLLEQMGYTRVDVVRDYKGNNRFVTAIRP